VNWYPAGKGLSLKPVNCFFSKDSLIFAGTLTDGVYRTADTGKTWSPSNLGGAQLDVRAFASSGGNLFAATFGSGVFVSTNNGESWHTANTGLTNTFLLSLATVRLAGGGTVLFAGSASAGMFTSTDNGTTWGPVTLALSENTVSALMADGTSIYAGTTDGVLVSSDGGIHWKEITAGFTQSTVNSLLLVPGNVLAATTGGVFESSTRGATWTRLNEGLTGANVNSISVSGTTLIAGTTANGVFVRTVGDTSWKGTTVKGLITVVGSSGGTLLASPAGNGVYYSPNNGTTWIRGQGTAPVSLSDIVVIEGFAASPGYAYAACNGKGFFRSTDDGHSWALANTGMKDLHAHACVANETYVYLSTAAGVFISGDNGDNWFPISNGLGNHSVTALAVNGKTLLAGTVDAGVYVSTDNGSDWRPANAGLPVLSIKSIVTDGQDVYAGTTSSGTCRRPLAELLLSLAIGDSPEPSSGFALAPNYPNPFNPSTRISYTVPEEGFVRLFVFDALGREIDRLVNGRMPAGTHATEWHPSVASGVYFYRIEVSAAGSGGRSFAFTRRMILLR
jgi:ligand-binding sensor domain-containing protein